MWVGRFFYFGMSGRIGIRIRLSNWSGVVQCRWSDEQFRTITKALHLQPQIFNYQSQAYYRNYKDPYNCRIRLMESGKLLILGAKSKQQMEEMVVEKVVCKIMQKIPNTSLSVSEDLVVTSYDAALELLFHVGVGHLGELLFHVGAGALGGIPEKEQEREGMVEIGESVHGLANVRVFLGERQILVKKANLIDDLYLFGLYLHLVLLPFRSATSPMDPQVESQLNQMAAKLKM